MQVRVGALGAAIVLFAIDARADDVVQLDDEPVPQQQLQPVPTLPPPETLEEFRSRMKERKEALRNARLDRNFAATAAIEADIGTLDNWYRRNTHVNSQGMFIGGIVMVSAGAASLAIGLTMILVGMQSCLLCSRSSSDNGLITGGAVATVGGLVLALGSIPMMIVGHRRVMGAPEVSLYLGPTSGIQGTF